MNKEKQIPWPEDCEVTEADWQGIFWSLIGTPIDSKKVYDLSEQNIIESKLEKQEEDEEEDIGIFNIYNKKTKNFLGQIEAYDEHKIWLFYPISKDGKIPEISTEDLPIMEKLLGGFLENYDPKKEMEEYEKQAVRENQAFSMPHETEKFRLDYEAFSGILKSISDGKLTPIYHRKTSEGCEYRFIDSKLKFDLYLYLEDDGIYFKIVSPTLPSGIIDKIKRKIMKKKDYDLKIVDRIINVLYSQ